MFERFTEPARRVIFFGRHEAGDAGANSIECGHLMLAMLRESSPLRRRLQEAERDEVRTAILGRLPRGESHPSTMDLPLNAEAKRALAYAAEEAGRLGSAAIEADHLLLGVLKADRVSAELLRGYGITPETVVTDVERHAASDAATPALQEPMDRLDKAIARVLRADTSGNTSRHEVMGQLIDWTIAHHQLFARALTEPSLTLSVPPPQDYSGMPFAGLQSLWVELTRVIVHMLSRMPEAKLATSVDLGDTDAAPLEALIHGYVADCEGLVTRLVSPWLHPG